MTHDDDPERLIRSPGESPGENDRLRTLLSAGQGELPDASRLASLAAKLGPMMGPGGPGGGGGGGSGSGGGGGGGSVAGAAKGTAAAAGGATAAKVAAVLVAVAVSVGSVVAWRLARRPSQDAAAVSAVAASVQSASSVPTPAPPPLPAAEPDEPPVLAAADAGRGMSAPSTTSARPSPRLVDPDQEVKLLHQAQDSLAADPAEALSLCAEHAKTFPQGLLGQEREVIAIDALVRLGRVDEAHARARRFAATYPGSTHLRRIDALLEKAR